MSVCVFVSLMSDCISRDAVNLELPPVVPTWKNKCLCPSHVKQKGDTTEKMEKHWPYSAGTMQNNSNYNMSNVIPVLPDGFFTILNCSNRTKPTQHYNHFFFSF